MLYVQEAKLLLSDIPVFKSFYIESNLHKKKMANCNPFKTVWQTLVMS